MGINDVAVSSGSACTSASLEPSYVLKALGAGDDLAHSSIRFGLGRWTTKEEVDYVADKLTTVVTRLREMSPLYELAKEGVDLSTMQWAALRDTETAVSSDSDRTRRETTMAYSNKVIDHYENPRNVGSLPKDDRERRHRPRRRAGVRRRHEAAGQGEPRDRRHRRREVQDVRLRLGDRELEPGDRVAEGQDGRRGAGDQEHRHRQRAEPAAGEDSLLGAGRGRHQGGDRRLQEEAGRRRPATAPTSTPSRRRNGSGVGHWERSARCRTYSDHDSDSAKPPRARSAR